MKRDLTIITILLSALLFLAACAAPEAPVETGAPAAPEATEAQAAAEAPAITEAPAAKSVFGDFTAQDINMNEVSSSIFEGKKVTMVNIWATFCGPCITEMPYIGTLAKEYAEKGLQVVGIVIDAAEGNGEVDDSLLAEAKRIISETGADYLHILPSESLTKAYLNNVQFVPTTVFVDENGVRIGDEYVGGMSEADWRAVFDEMLEAVA